MVSLAGKHLAIALLGATALGVTAGVTLEGWRKARGLPVECVADAGVQLQVDAGVTSRAECQATIEHWSTVTVPGPIRYLPGDAGVAEPQLVTILVPDVRLSGQVAGDATFDLGVEAEASASVVVAPGAAERHWSAGPAALYGVTSRDLLVGGQVGWSGGPFGVQVMAMGGERGVFLGAGVSWRW